MRLRSLANQTDLIFPRFDGEIVSRGDYLVVKTPDNPTYIFGNYLLFLRSPKSGDYARWADLFEQEFRSPPLVRHKTFVWDETGEQPGGVQDFIDNGCTFEQSVVMTTSSPCKPSRVLEELEIRPLQRDREWMQAVQNQVVCRQPQHQLESYRRFKSAQMARYRRMADAGVGYWFGGFLGERLVSDLGVFVDGPLGRFQNVETHPAFRRRGACGTLVWKASQYMLNACGVQTLVLVADPDHHAARIYESVGFSPTEHHYAAFRVHHSV